MTIRATKIKKATIDFLIYVATLTVINYLFSYRNYGSLVKERLMVSLRHSIPLSLAIVLLAALFRWAIKWKIMMTLKRITPGDIETCRSILRSNRWTKLTPEEKNTLGEIIDKTAFKYSS